MLNESIDDDYIQYVEVDDDNILHDEVIYEMNDNVSDETEILSHEDLFKISENTYERTCSSVENDLEAMLYDYSLVIECLMSERYQRSQSDIAILSQLLQSIPDFMYINATDLEYVCQAAKLLTIVGADEIIVRKCSVLRDWFLCVEGSLRKEDGGTTLIGPGGFVGTDLWSEETLISDYDLYSSSNGCKLLVIGISDLKPTGQLNNLIIKTNDEKSIITIYEAYSNPVSSDDTCGYILTKGTNEALISHLFSQSKYVAPDYVEDFFLTHKLFLDSSTSIRNEILNSIYLENEYAKDKFEVLIRWISQSFSEFEKDNNKLLFIYQIINILKNQNNNNWLYALCECCSNVAKVRDLHIVLSLKNCVYPVELSDNQTIFYIQQDTNIDNGLHTGDLLIELEGVSIEAITLDLIMSLSDDDKHISISVKSDLLGYHEHVLKDISMDSLSIHSTPPNTQYLRCQSEKTSNDSDNISIMSPEKNPSIQKRPSILPNLFSNLQSGTIGRFFKNSKYYAKSAMSSTNRSNSDVASRLDNLQNGNRDISGSTLSMSRFSRRLKSKRRRQSIGSNADLIKSFDDLVVNENDFPVDRKAPIRIHVRDMYINNNPNSKSDMQYFHLLILPTTTVTEVIVRILLKLNLVSASSSKFYLVEVNIDESSGMIHEKILHHNTTNLIERLKEHSRFYIKNISFVGESLLLPSEADRMRENLKTPPLLSLSLNNLVVRLFLYSYNRLCKLNPDEILSYVTCKKGTLKNNKGHKQPESGVGEYIEFSDFYKFWVITEICSIENDINKRASTIHYFIHLALKALYIGHIDLFFSLISGLEHVDVLRLSLSWDKVSKRDKKLLQNLKTTLDVTGNMRNLRIVHQKMSSPIIPVTAMVIKDLTILEETHPTYASGTINGLQVNDGLVNFDKMRKMSRIVRTFINSSCSCREDKSRPVRKHLMYCKTKYENREKLLRFLQHRVESQLDVYCPSFSTQSLADKFHRMYSFSSVSAQSSSSESLSESASSIKSTEEQSNYQIFEQRMMIMKIERYLKTLKDRVITDPITLSYMSLSCENNSHSDGIYETKLRNSSRNLKNKEDFVTNSKLTNGIDLHVSDKAAEFLGINVNSTDSDECSIF